MLHFFPITTCSPRYTYVEELLHSAFPRNERRDDERQRLNTDRLPHFHCLLVQDGEEPVGLLTWWDFPRFRYVEHFAISPSLRGKGYGHWVLEAFLGEASKPVVLEVEHPTDEQSRRRIAFYRSCGLTLWECDYLQPPYRRDDAPLPLYLMVSPGLSPDEDYGEIRETIHREVYGFSA